jgi:hypothetical protein
VGASANLRKGASAEREFAEFRSLDGAAAIEMINQRARETAILNSLLGLI